MTDPTINLRKDCEAFYTFDERSFDSQRNVIQDRSGYGRHAEARGGPSIGVSGPDSFEAASFDGSDDYFSHYNLNLGLQSEFTTHILFRSPELSNSDTYLIGFSDSYDYIRLEGTGSIGYAAEDKVYKDFNVFGKSDQNKWLSLTTVLTENSFTNYINGRPSVGEQPDDVVPINRLNIGDRGGDGQKAADIDCALFGLWTRGLSEAEAKYLNRLTGPRRAQL